MFHDFYQNLPLHIDPIAFSIGSFSVRWYAISYIVGFVVIYIVLLWRIKNEDLKKTAQIFNFQFSIYNKKEKPLVISSQLSVVFDFMLVAFFCALIGGRIGYVLFYNFSYFLANPLAIVSPYDQSGSLVGIFGMSFHGALLGILLGSWIFLKRKKINFLVWADFVVPAVALGYFFGRIGNFLNGELYGRVTNSFLGMNFPADPVHLRHPSQLYEAFLEGLLLFAILWSLRKGKRSDGFLFGTYLIGYGIFRMIAEQFRQPDAQIGLLFAHFALGQLFSAGMVVGGLLVLLSKNKKKWYA